jgi:hypothetical protein
VKEIEWQTLYYGRAAWPENGDAACTLSDQPTRSCGVFQRWDHTIGLGSKYTEGWGRENLMEFVKETVKKVRKFPLLIWQARW